jgi:hypothetical protein
MQKLYQAELVKLQGLGLSTEKGIVCSPQVKIPLEKSTPRWEDNIKVDLTEVGCKYAYRIRVAQDQCWI